MKKIIIISILLCISSSFICSAGVRSAGIRTPRVNYISPKNDSEIDLKDDYLTFSWKPTPKPQGGRRAYRFTLYKGFKYDVVFSKKLDWDVYSIDVPSGVFESDTIYTWKVEQRGADGGWSADLRWSFKIIK